MSEKKNYLELMDDNEIRYILSGIGRNNLVKFYQHNSKLLNKLKPGFRAQSLPEKDLIEVTVKNRNNQVIYGWINEVTRNYVQDAQESIKNQSAPSQAKIITTCLHSSPFSDNPQLYFKLSDSQYDESVVNKVIDECKSFREKAENEDKPSQKDSNETDDNEIVNEFNNKCRQYELQIKNQEETIEELKKRADKADSLEKDFEVKNLRIPDHSDPYSYCSLCEVINDKEYGIELFRIDDILQNRITEKENTEFPSLKWLYLKEKNTSVGEIGIWDWNAEPSHQDPAKDYITVKRRTDFSPIQVILLKGFSDISELVDSLKEGVQFEASLKNLFICFKNSNDEYEGVLCNDKVLENKKGIFSLSSVTNKLDKYTVNKYDIIRTQLFDKREIYFIRPLNLQVDERIPLGNENEIIRRIFLNQLSKKNVQKYGYDVKDINNCRQFIESISEDTMIPEIKKHLSCTEEEANKFLENFIQDFDYYISPEEVTVDSLWRVINTHPELEQKAIKLAQDRWNKDNETRFKEADQNYEIAKKKVLEKRKELQQLEKEIEENNKLAEDVETNVKAKIEDAKKNAAEFISRMAFVNSGTGIANITDERESLKLIPGIKFDGNNDLGDEAKILDELEDEYEIQGVDTHYARFLGEYLYTLHLNGFHVLMAGPSSERIIDVLSAKLYNHTAGHVVLSGDYSDQAIEDILSSKEEIVIIENPFHPKWYPTYLTLLEKTDKQLVAVVPFADDVMMEPKGLLDYFTPVFTNSLVTDIPREEIMGGICAKELIEDRKHAAEKCRVDSHILKAFALKGMLKAHVSKTLRFIESIESGLEADDICEVAMVPIMKMLNSPEKNEFIIKNIADKLGAEAKCRICKELGIPDD